MPFTTVGDQAVGDTHVGNRLLFATVDGAGTPLVLDVWNPQGHPFAHKAVFVFSAAHPEARTYCWGSNFTKDAVFGESGSRQANQDAHQAKLQRTLHHNSGEVVLLQCGLFLTLRVVQKGTNWSPFCNAGVSSPAFEGLRLQRLQKQINFSSFQSKCPKEKIFGWWYLLCFWVFFYNFSS